MPDVIGMSQGDAVRKLQKEGFAVAVIQHAQCNGAKCSPPPGVVWKQDPAADTKLKQGKTVTIWSNP